MVLNKQVKIDLKQTSKNCHEDLTCVLFDQWYKQSDHSLFTLHKNSSFIVPYVYVDVVILLGNSLDEFDKMKKNLDFQFKFKYLGQLKYFLGIKVAHSKIGICQRNYFIDILSDT